MIYYPCIIDDAFYLSDDILNHIGHVSLQNIFDDRIQAAVDLSCSIGYVGAGNVALLTNNVIDDGVDGSFYLINQLINVEILLPVFKIFNVEDFVEMKKRVEVKVNILQLYPV